MYIAIMPSEVDETYLAYFLLFIENKKQRGYNKKRISTYHIAKI